MSPFKHSWHRSPTLIASHTLQRYRISHLYIVMLPTQPVWISLTWGYIRWDWPPNSCKEARWTGGRAICGKNLENPPTNLRNQSVASTLSRGTDTSRRRNRRQWMLEWEKKTWMKYLIYSWEIVSMDAMVLILHLIASFNVNEPYVHVWAHAIWLSYIS